MLARIAINILPCQASSAPCKHLFSACKDTAADRRSRLSSIKPEQLQVLKFALSAAVIPYLAASNQQDEELIYLSTYEVLHTEDIKETSESIDRDFSMDDDYYVFVDSS